MQGAELNSRMHDWRLGEWEDAAKRQQREQARDAIETAVDERRGFLTFWGDFGAGKTYALQIIINEMRVKEIECFYAPLTLILDHLRSLYRTGTQSSRYWQRLMDVPALAVDEVTRYYETPWAKDRLWALTDTRYRRLGSHLTIFATNDDPREALPTAESIGHLYSRMRQGRLVELRGDVRPAMARKEINV
jgi:DNA replication protein DnaC